MVVFDKSRRALIGLIAFLSGVTYVDGFCGHRSAVSFPSVLRPSTPTRLPFRQQKRLSPLTRKASTNDGVSQEEVDELFDGKMTLSLVGGQAALIPLAVAAGFVLRTPNLGFGPGISFDTAALTTGVLYVIPLGIIAVVLEFVEKYVPALQAVSEATQRSVMALLGGTFKPGLAVLISVALGCVAGFGEEMLFRGILQYEIAQRFGTALALGATSVVFGLLHAFTPLYAVMATMASVYFGYLYQMSGNLAVPIITHAVYDLGALLAAHWTVTQLTDRQRAEILGWLDDEEEETVENDRPTP